MALTHRSPLFARARALLLALALLLSVLGFAATPALAAGPACTVSSTGADYTTIQAAVDDAGCTSITVAAGTYAEHVTITRDVTISGAGASGTIVDGTHTETVFTITSGAVTLQNLTIANGSDPSQSGGIVNRGILTLKNSIISGNSAGEGGGIFNGNVLRLNNSTISGNSGSLGGGIFNESSMVLNNSTISSNSATEGGGIFNAAGATLTVNNSTISSNSATAGGGILNFSFNDMAVNNSTISGNSAADGGGILNTSFSGVTMSNSIIANNPSSGECAGGGTTDSGGNIADDGSCNFTAASSRSSTDPKLDPRGLQDNGGPTQTIALLPGSPAIDAATADCPDIDQRGVTRPQDGNGDGAARCDIGALELQGSDITAPAITISSPANAAVYLLGQGVAANYACADEQDGSGIGSCIGTVASGANIDTASVGSHSFTVQATDKAGNTASQSVTYQVVYSWSGFVQPVDNLPTVNSAKAGSAVPVKFSLGGNYGLSIFAQGYPKVQTVACGSGAPTDEIEQTVTAGASGLKYDAATGQYSYTWKTDKSWAGSCRQLVLRLVDGTDHIALFQFR